MSWADILAMKPGQTPPYAAPSARPGFTPPYAPEAALPSLPPSSGPVGQPQKGLGGFLNRFLEPTSALGQFGKALVMAGGTPIGQAYAYMDQQKLANRKLSLEEQDHALDTAYKQAQIAHLGQPEKTALQRNYEYFQSIGHPELAESYLQAEGNPLAALNVTDPTTGATGLQFYRKGGGLPGAMAPQTNMPPPAAIERLRQHPDKAADFDAMFGPGAAARALGGATGNPSPTFPMMDAVISQESGGRPGAIGPQTQWGRAMGIAQLLPSTAKAMAEKLGLPWREDLMRATTPEATEYQRSLGEAYLNEGLAATGNPRDALRYYHGGPNRRMWGPKTNRYADSVLARMGAL